MWHRSIVGLELPYIVKERRTQMTNYVHVPVKSSIKGLWTVNPLKGFSSV